MNRPLAFFAVAALTAFCACRFCCILLEVSAYQASVSFLCLVAQILSDSRKAELSIRGK